MWPDVTICEWIYRNWHHWYSNPRNSLQWRHMSMNVSYFSDCFFDYDDVIMGAMASQITSLTIVYSTVYSDADQSKHQSSASLAFVRGIHRGPVNSTHKWQVTRKVFPFDDVIMQRRNQANSKGIIKARHYGLFVWETHLRSVVSRAKD